MITEQELREAIAECQGQRNPNAQTCIKLAAYYTILNNITEDEKQTYSYSNEPVVKPPDYIEYEGESDFAKLVNGKEVKEVWELVDELMLTLQLVNPRLYESFMRKLK